MQTILFTRLFRSYLKEKLATISLSGKGGFDRKKFLEKNKKFIHITIPAEINSEVGDSKRHLNYFIPGCKEMRLQVKDSQRETMHAFKLHYYQQ